MRDIRFRAWIYSEKVMVPVERLFMPLQSHSLIIGASNEERTIGVNHKESEKDIEIMQYIGLKDINGKEIYEGDIVKRIIYDEIRTYQCIYNEELSGFTFKKVFALVDLIFYEVKILKIDVEVIGNIYENPELLKFK